MQVFCCLALGAASGSLRSAEMYVAYPTDGTHRIDICLHWGMECAGEAARAWCQARGFDGAIEWEVEQDIGAQSPTVVIGSGQVCAEAHCDGYFSITCAKEDEWTQSTGHGGIAVEALPTDSLGSTEGVLVLAVAENDERTSAAAAVNSYGFAFLHAPPGKYRMFLLDWKNAKPIRPQPAQALEVAPGKEGMFFSVTVD